MTNRRAAPAPLTLTAAQRLELAGRLLAVDGPLADRKAFTRADIIRVAAPLLYGYRTDELGRVVAEVTNHRDAVALIGQPGCRNRSWAVASVLDTEDAIAGCADRLARRTDAAHCPKIGRHRAGVSRWQVDGHRLTPGQADAIRAVLTSRRGLDVIIGVAGSGKTTALRIVHGAFATRRSKPPAASSTPSSTANPHGTEASASVEGDGVSRGGGRVRSGYRKRWRP